MDISYHSPVFGNGFLSDERTKADGLSRYTIIDEADEMVSDDWTEDMKRILSGGGNTSSVARGDGY